MGINLYRPVSIAPLVTFRIVFGALMAFSAIRFMTLGWIEDHYIEPVFHFRYYGFSWLPVWSGFWLYVIHIVMIASALCVMAGLWYRWAAVVLFLTFTYTELIDLTYYLNHYYFVSLVSLLLIFVPANRYFSVDVWRNPSLRQMQVPVWCIGVFQVQLAIVYTYAGLAKINSDWLIEALPLKIWVPANDTLPLIGPLFRWKLMPYLFSWIGMLYDCTIVGWLWWRRTRLLAYVTVVVFHVLTGLMFQIGVFPLVMIGATLLFFSEHWHLRLWAKIRSFLPGVPQASVSQLSVLTPDVDPLSASMTHDRVVRSFGHRWGKVALGVFVGVQLLFPWRYLLYPGNLFWTEEGYRFSWRVMLMEKAGTATFYVRDACTGHEGEVVNQEFLNAHQEKQMSMQPDMILQYAHFLADYYQKKGVCRPAVRAEVYVTLNARPSRLLIDPSIDLTQLTDTWSPKKWILPDSEP